MTVPQFNIAQDLFLVLFAILYGIMLQSIMGFQPFPLAKTRKGYVNRSGKVDSSSDEWLKRMWIKRVILSIILLNVFPFIYLWGILYLLHNGSVSPTFSSPCDFVNVGFIFWSALGVFGFYRFYHAIAVVKWRSLFCDVVEKFEDRTLSFDAWAHFIWGLVYLLPPLIYLLLYNFLPALLGMWGVFPVLFLLWIIHVFDC